MGCSMHWEHPGDADEKQSSFSANESGMRSLCAVMSMLGLTVNTGPAPLWPRAETFGTSNEMVCAITYPHDATYEPVRQAMTDEDRQKVAAYRNAEEAHRRWHGPTATVKGIPAHKFVTNDLWLVTPEECRATIHRWHKLCRADNGGEQAVAEAIGRALQLSLVPGGAAWWLEWIRFVEGAVTHGGFRVC